ncbi:MAG: T9SS type A sorting domain-containing protein [Saprospiraceae bacterium]|nr:T9SS type A sorting domain-containing protein [Saprospiraceae bacterium]
MKRHVFTILLWAFGYCVAAQSSFEITKFPKNLQLIPRNPLTNIGTYTIEGSGMRSANFSQLQARIWKDDALERTYLFNLPTNQDRYTFSIPINIKAELKNYKIELIGIRGNQEITLAKADKVVAGDVFIINGQSNCIGRTEPEDYSPFMRSYTDQFGWNDIDYTSPSKWGPRMAKKIIDIEHIPVAIFCEAFGGMRQTWYMRRPDSPYTAGNYGILYSRLKKAEVEKNIRALLWWQGESDGWETSLEDFKSQFKTLYNQWKEDYNTPVFYFQVRFRACTHRSPDIFEAQRQLVNEIPNIEVLSNNPALSPDGCHFMYKNGYDNMGEQAYNLLAARLYNRTFVNVRAPNILEAFFSGQNEITLKMKNVTGNLKVMGSPWVDFKLEGCNARIVGGSASDYRIKLFYVGDTSGLTGISYLSRIDSSSQNWIVNPMGVGILLFYNIPINKRQLTSLSEHTEGGIFSVFPTYVTDRLTIEYSKTISTPTRIDIFDLRGKLVLSHMHNQATNRVDINVQYLTKGIYFIRLNIDNQKVETMELKKIIVI